MALIPHKITALAESDAQGTDGKNIVAGAVVSLFDENNNAVTLFDNDAGANGSTTKTTDATGQVVVYVTPGEYEEQINGGTRRKVSIFGNSTANYATTAELAATRPTQTGQMAVNRERANAQYVLAASGYTAKAGDITAANGRVWRLIGGSYNQSLTVDIPTDYATMQEAIDYYHNKVLFADGSELIVNINSGHQPSSGISVANGDYSYIRITSDDAEVTVSPLWDGGGAIVADNARPPVLDTIIDLNGLATSSGYYLNNSSVGYIASGAGMRNGANRGAHISNGSTLAADGSIFTGFNQAGIHASRASTVQCANADLRNNSQDPFSTFGALYASRASKIHAPNLNLTNSGGDGVRVQRLSTIVVPDIDVSNCAGIAFVGNGGDIMADSGSPVTNNLGGQLVNVQNNARVYLGDVTATFQAGMTDFAVECRHSGIYVRSLNLSGHEGVAVYAIGAGALIDIPAYACDGGIDAINCLDLAVVNAERCAITNATRYGISVASGAKVTVEDGSITDSTNDDIYCAKGGSVIAINCTTTNGVGSPNATDTNFTAFNTIVSNRGIIWA